MRPRRKTGLGCLGFLVFVVVLAFVQGGLQFAVDSVLNPWAHTWTGKPVLPGMWVGRIKTPGGQVWGVLLDLRRATNRRGRYSTCRSCPRIEGTAQTCGGGDVVQAYEVWGGPDTWDGTRFHLKQPLPKGTARAGLHLGAMQGEWAGDALNLSTKLTHRGGGSVDDGADAEVPTTFTLARGSEADFLSACRELGAATGK